MKRNSIVQILLSAVFLTACGCNGSDLTIDVSKIVTDTNAPPVNLSVEIARANREDKLLLLEFGSSDSCPPCILYQQKVFSAPEFKAYEKSNLDFVRLDFPFKVQLRPETEATNHILAKQFEVIPFPTFIALDRDGKEFWRMPDKNDSDPKINISLFTPKNFISLIESIREKKQKNKPAI